MKYILPLPSVADKETVRLVVLVVTPPATDAELVEMTHVGAAASVRENGIVQLVTTPVPTEMVPMKSDPATLGPTPHVMFPESGAPAALVLHVQFPLTYMRPRPSAQPGGTLPTAGIPWPNEDRHASPWTSRAMRKIKALRFSIRLLPRRRYRLCLRLM